MKDGEGIFLYMSSLIFENFGNPNIIGRSIHE